MKASVNLREMNYTPALSLPMYGDPKGKMVWPQDHALQCVKQLHEVDKICIIGWRAADPHIVDLIFKNINLDRVKFLQIVDISENAAESVIKNLPKAVSEIDVRPIISSTAFLTYVSGSAPQMIEMFTQ